MFGKLALDALRRTAPHKEVGSEYGLSENRYAFETATGKLACNALHPPVSNPGHRVPDTASAQTPHLLPHLDRPQAASS